MRLKGIELRRRYLWRSREFNKSRKTKLLKRRIKGLLKKSKREFSRKNCSKRNSKLCRMNEHLRN